jgi:hypothetical protein
MAVLGFEDQGLDDLGYVAANSSGGIRRGPRGLLEFNHLAREA